MKKIIIAVAMLAGISLNAAAYFDGSLSGTNGAHGYKGMNLNLVIGTGNLAIEPSLATYTSDTLNKTYRTYAVRAAVEEQKYTVAGFVGTTPEVNNYSNKFIGGDITFSLTPGSGGHSRLAGPGSRGGARGGQGVNRIDIGAGLKHTMHAQAQAVGSDKDTAQTEGSLFAGAKIMMINMSASYTGYKYGDDDVTPQGFVPGLNFALAAMPKSSINVKLDLPGQPLVTPFVSYTSTKYKGGTEDSSAYLLGAYLDFSMVRANVGYQIFNDGSKNHNFLSIGAGVKF